MLRWKKALRCKSFYLWGRVRLSFSTYGLWCGRLVDIWGTTISRMYNKRYRTEPTKILLMERLFTKYILTLMMIYCLLVSSPFWSTKQSYLYRRPLFNSCFCSGTLTSQNSVNMALSIAVMDEAWKWYYFKVDLAFLESWGSPWEWR